MILVLWYNLHAAGKEGTNDLILRGGGGVMGGDGGNCKKSILRLIQTKKMFARCETFKENVLENSRRMTETKYLIITYFRDLCYLKNFANL